MGPILDASGKELPAPEAVKAMDRTIDTTIFNECVSLSQTTIVNKINDWLVIQPRNERGFIESDVGGFVGGAIHQVVSNLVTSVVNYINPNSVQIGYSTLRMIVTVKKCNWRTLEVSLIHLQ